MAVEKYTSNIRGTRRDFFSTHGGIECKVLSVTPVTLPDEGSAFIYRKANGLWYELDSNGIETLIGPGGASVSDFDIKEYTFSYDVASPYTLCAVVTGDRIKKVAIKIETAFDDLSATLSVGHTGNVNGLLATTENVASSVAHYEVTSDFKYDGNDTIKLYLTPGTSTQGSGIVFLEIEKTG